ncbi:thermonuclease family protein, partial [Janibacter anophelis]|uniref:thermonuclease family protein n=1 Tax=Janibacter anophelis TaxID=319054 RepID=UPI0039EDF351
MVGAALAVVMLAACGPEATDAQGDAEEVAAAAADVLAASAESDQARAEGGSAAKGSESASSAAKVKSNAKATAKPKSSSAKSAAPARGKYRVIRVVDGDTVKVDINGGESVRVIGIDAPESVHPDEPVECGGVEASAKAKAMLEGKRVNLVYDSTQAKRDRYGRLLAYVELPGVGDFGKSMIRAGHAREYTYAAAYRRQATYRSAERQARSADRGIWGDCSQAEPVPAYTPPPAPSPSSSAPAPASA